MRAIIILVLIIVTILYLIKWIFDECVWVLYYRPRPVDTYYDENGEGKKRKHKKNRKRKNKAFNN